VVVRQNIAQLVKEVLGRCQRDCGLGHQFQCAFRDDRALENKETVRVLEVGERVSMAVAMFKPGRFGGVRTNSSLALATPGDGDRGTTSGAT
jgi:hypothetical protein